MKICLINNLYKPYNRGGADKITGNIAQGLEKKGYKIFIISTCPKGKKRQKAKEEKNCYYLTSSFSTLNKIPKNFRLLWHIFDTFNLIKYFEIKKILKKEKPSLIITHNLKGLGALTPRLIKKLGIKHIHYLHDIQLIHPSGLIVYGEEKKLQSLFTKIYAYLNKKLFSSPAIIISPSQWLMNQHEEFNFFPKSKKIILPNPIQIKINNNPTTHKKEDAFNFLYVGEIEKHKGAPWLAQVFSEIEKKISGIKLSMIGRGSLSEKIKNTYSNINLLGWQNNEKVRQHIRQSDALIVPSFCYENSPTVIYEAVAEALPVISSRLGGASELINHFNGFLFSPGNKEDLEEKIRYFIQNHTVIKKNAQLEQGKIAEQNIEIYTKKLEKIIRE